MNKTAFLYAPALAHDFPRHPENSRRGPAAWGLLEQYGVLPDLVQIEPEAAEWAQLTAVHEPAMLERVQGVSLRGGGRIDQDTYATEASFDLARLAAGAVCQGIDAIGRGEVDNGYVFVRPPGHHAEIRQPGGFCLINNVAVGARHAQAAYGWERVAIIDFDVHHGNGTQDIFYQDPSVLFVSTHQYGRFFYPGTGALPETGAGAGVGTTMNLALPAGVGDSGMTALFDELIYPKLAQFRPQLLLISAGFDAHWSDPLTQLEVSLTGFAGLAQRCLAWSREFCDGRLLFVQEGGYVLDVLGHAVLNTVRALQGRDEVVDPFGESTAAAPNLNELMTTVRGLHLI